MKYEAVIFDADDTLVDYAADACRAFHVALAAVGRDEPDVYDACVRFDYGNWETVGLGDVHLPHVQANYHTMYRAHVRDIFRYADEVCGLGGRAKEAEGAFLTAFFDCGQPIEGAKDAVRALKGVCRVYAATNGLSAQRNRLREFPLDGVFISEELGAIKPTPAFFSAMLHAIGLPPHRCLMVGDSLASDVIGAQNAGMGCVFFAKDGQKAPDGVQSVTSLSEIFSLVTK